MKIEKKSKQQKETISEGWLYNIHHLHHFKDVLENHEIHHCFLTSEKDQKGTKYEIFHFLDKTELYHCISQGHEGILFDHKNNEYLITPKLIGSDKIFVVSAETHKKP